MCSFFAARLSLRSLICAVASALILLLSLSRADAAASPSSALPASAALTSATPLGDLLGPDGTLSLPPGFAGSLDARGWELVSGQHEPPRFVPRTSVGPEHPVQGDELATPRVAGDEKWAAGFIPNGIDPSLSGDVNALVADGSGNIYVGGGFSAVSNIAANHVAKWDGTTWSALGNGLNATVNALVWDSAHQVLYAGGSFQFLCEDPDCIQTLAWAGYIAQWDPATSTWSTLSYGLSRSVYALAVTPTGDLFVGGIFAAFCRDSGCHVVTDVNYVAKWNWSSSSWTQLVMGGTNIGVSGPVNALACDSACKYVYLGGDFIAAGGVTVNRVTRWDPFGNVFDPFQNGVSGPVHALAVDILNGHVYVGGDFTAWCGDAPCTPNVQKQALHVLRWNTSSGTWSDLSSGLDNAVYALTLDGSNNVFAAGSFASYCTAPDCSSSTSVGYIAKWNPTGWGSWSSLGTGLDLPAHSLVWGGTNLYAGGQFSLAGSAMATGIGRWNGSTWSALAVGNTLSATGDAAVADGKGNIYVGGGFHTAGGLRVSHIAKWNGSGWSALGYGFTGYVIALAIDKEGNLIAGGSFSSACENAACTTWSRINNVARWTPGGGGTWSAIGNGLSGSVWSLAVDSNSNIYAGGSVTGVCTALDCASTAPAYKIVKWTASSGTWDKVGIGVTGNVQALAIDASDNVYVGGSFDFVCGNSDCTSNGTQVNHIAMWNGAWSKLGEGVNNGVFALALDSHTNLFVGGMFSHLCGNPNCSVNGTQVNYVAKWGPGSPAGVWSSLAYGFTWVIESLVIDSSDNLFAGGSMDQLCGAADCRTYGARVNNIARWDGSIWSALGSGIRPRSGGVYGLAWQFGKVTAVGSFALAGDKVSVNFAQYLDNNPPTLSHIAKNGKAGIPLAFTAAEFTGALADIEAETLAKIKVLALPAHGTLRLNGTAVAANQEMPLAIVANLTFTPAAGWTGTTSFSWNGHDGNSYAMNSANVNITISPNAIQLPLVIR